MSLPPTDAAYTAEARQQTPPRLPAGAAGRGAVGPTGSTVPSDPQEGDDVASTDVPVPHWGVGAVPAVNSRE